MMERMNRREFAATSAAALMFARMNAQAQAPAAGWKTIAYNVLECQGWTAQTASERKTRFTPQVLRRIALELALYEPAIVNFSESPSENVVAEIARLLEMKYAFFPSGEKWPGALLTRWTIVESKNCPVPGGRRPEDLFTRHWGTARLRDANGEEILVHSIHLHPNNSEIRLREISIILDTLRSAPAGSVLLQGDLNHTPDTPEYRRWTEAGLTDAIAHTSAEGPTFRVDNMNRRLDYVLVRGRLQDRIVAARPLAEGAFVLNAADPGSIALSDHIPVMAHFGAGSAD
jgi:endonuclease/exonuclease/phosphatase family metal-dependent hydrolase